MTRNPKNSHRDDRYEKWRKLNPELIAQLPNDDAAYILGQCEGYGRWRFAQERRKYFRDHHRLDASTATILTFAVILVGALTLSLVPNSIAKKAGQSSALATTLGFMGGAAASYFGHSAATRYLTQIKLQQSLLNARNQLEQPDE